MIKSYSKINLFLRILKKNKNNLHNIQSVVMLLDLHDTIKIKFSRKDIIKFTGKFRSNVNKSNNSITKSLSLLRKYKLVNKEQKYKIIVNKKIPVFAGLGGGTSNAAFVIKYFLKKKINKKLLSIFEKEIGSDFRLFFYNQVYQKSLKNIIKFKKKYSFFFFVSLSELKVFN